MPEAVECRHHPRPARGQVIRPSLPRPRHVAVDSLNSQRMAERPVAPGYAPLSMMRCSRHVRSYVASSSIAKQMAPRNQSGMVGSVWPIASVSCQISTLGCPWRSTTR
jgi:hypothetical protein